MQSMLFLSVPALALDDCYPRFGEGNTFAASEVTVPKAFFFKPDGSKSHRYVVKGDEVITFNAKGKFTCALYMNDHNLKSGAQLTGLMEEKSLRAIDANLLPPETLLGKWAQFGEVTISPGPSPDIVRVEGKTANERYNEETDTTTKYTGEIPSVEVRRSGNSVGFTLDGGEVGKHHVIGVFRSFSKALPSDGCAAKLQLLGRRSLFVRDNERCGGASITFSGLYSKRMQ